MTGANSRVYDTAIHLARGLAANPKNIARVAQETSEDAARWAFTQWALRGQAKAKFENPEEMLFTREALEQATAAEIARYHASNFPRGATVADLTTGIGADLIQLASRGPVIGYELDPERAEYAKHNLSVQQPNVQAEIIVADSIQALSNREYEYAWADPSRRSEGKRTLDPLSFSPDPQVLARHMRQIHLGGIKLSPMLPDDYLEAFDGRLEFISYKGECREAVIWLGQEAVPGRWAVQIDNDARLQAGDPPPTTDQPGKFIFEAGPAAIRAHALGTLCEQHGLQALADSNGYLTGDATIESAWLTEYETLSELLTDLKKLKAEIRSFGIGTLVVKSRASGVDVRALSRQLGSKEGREAILIVYPRGKSLQYLLATRQ